MDRAEDGGDESEGESHLRTTTSAATTTTRGDSFLVSCYADEDEDDDDQVKLPGLGSSSKGLSPDALGESLVVISDSNFFDFDKDLNDELYSTADLF